jgi:hypothetical protein
MWQLDEHAWLPQERALPILEGAVFVLFFRGYLREFDRLPLGAWGWWLVIVALSIALAAFLRFRLELTRKVLAAGVLIAFLVEIPLSRYGTAAWPLSRKMAGYATSTLVQFFHFLSLYLATWIPCLFPLSFAKPLRRILLAVACLYLLCDYEYFRQTGGHVLAGHIAMFFGRDSLKHIGLAPGWWKQPLASFVQLASLMIGANLLAGKVDGASR